jgi:hypothetical protein
MNGCQQHWIANGVDTCCRHCVVGVDGQEQARKDVADLEITVKAAQATAYLVSCGGEACCCYCVVGVYGQEQA